jgi:DNA polymerase-3 subunit delta'
MDNLVVHPKTRQDIERLVARPAHAVLLLGSKGVGKMSLAIFLAVSILDISVDTLEKYPYMLTIASQDGRAISIETIRQLQHFTTLKIPGKEGIRRLVIIESADLMTTEAQNALLKTLEEPPADTVFILTATSSDSLLPTIRSRVRTLQVSTPALDELKEYLTRNYSASDVDKALLISGGLPGLTVSLLTSPEDHPLYEATNQARQILQSSAYERLTLIEGLSKQKQLCLDTTFILGQMAHMALMRAQGDSAARWQKILKAAYEAQEHLRTNTQTKLVLMNLMLEI